MSNNQLFEMAVLAKGLTIKRDKKTRYNIQLHGGDDRIYPPHLHIYKEGSRLADFSIEVNLAHYLDTGGDIQFCRIIDKDKGIDYKSPELCWKYTNFMQFHDLIRFWLPEKPTQKDFLDCQDNIAAAIKAFAKEADMSQLHIEDKKNFSKIYNSLYTSMRPEYKLIFVMLSMHKTINKKYHYYFSPKLIKEFPNIFV